jgi:precorrin-6A/cobalt-precorrin-6A reductase
MILLIGGTSETASLAAGLAETGYTVLVSTATAASLDIGDHPRISRRAGRLDEEGMVSLGKEKGIRAIVDAAHPYAEAVHTAAHDAAGRLGIPYLLFRRPEMLTPERDRSPGAAEAHGKGFPGSSAERDTVPQLATPLPFSVRPPVVAGTPFFNADPAETAHGPVRFAADHAEAAEMAFSFGRPVLLTTGSRNLAPYAEAARRTGVPFAVRVLDIPESLAACRAAAIPEDRIIAGRGPFSVTDNLAAIHRFGIGVIVTKESGRAGGIDAKLAAARQAKCRLIVLRRPAMPAAGPVFDHPLHLISCLAGLVPAAVEASAEGVQAPGMPTCRPLSRNGMPG